MDNLQSSKVASEISALQNYLSTSSNNQTGIDTSQGYSLASTELDSFFSGFSSDISSVNSVISYNLSDLDSIVLGLSSDSSSTSTDFSSLGLSTDTTSLEELIASFPSSDSIDFGSLGFTTDTTSLEELTASFPSSDSIDFGSLGFTTDTTSLEELTASFPSSDSIDFSSLGLSTDLTSLEELIASFSSGSQSTDLSSSGLSSDFMNLIGQSSSTSALDQLASYLAGNNEIVAQSTAFNEIMNSQGYTEEYLQELYDDAQTAAALYPESTATGDVEEDQTAATTSHAAELGITDGEWARMNANLVDGKILVYGHTYYDKYNDKGSMPPGAPSINNYKNLIIEGNEYNDTYSRSAAWLEYEEIQAGKKDTYDGTYNGVLLGVRNWSE